MQRIVSNKLIKIARFSCSKMSSCSPIEQSMRAKLTADLKPAYLEIINESHMHNVVRGAESHFKIVVASDKFIDQSRLNRHRIINQILEDELKNGVHALSITAETVEQWESSEKRVYPSPSCRGGFGL